MSARSRPVVPLALATALLLAACGEPGSSAPTSGASTGPTGPALEACEPIAGDELIVLADDLGLQTVDNIVPAVNADVVAGAPGVLAVLDEVSATLDQDVLIGLNRAVDVERQTSSQVASAYLADTGLDAQDQVGDGQEVLVGAANFSESATLAEIYAGALRAAGFDAATQVIGNRETYAHALELGDLAVVPEYAGTLTEFLNITVNGPGAEPLASSDLDATMASLADLGAEVGLVFGTPASAQNQNAFAVTLAFAEAYDVSTLSQLAQTCGGIVLGGPPECPERSFCRPGLEEVYGLQIGEFTSLDAGGPLTKAALTQGQITLGLVFSSDAALAG